MYLRRAEEIRVVSDEDGASLDGGDDIVPGLAVRPESRVEDREGSRGSGEEGRLVARLESKVEDGEGDGEENSKLRVGLNSPTVREKPSAKSTRTQRLCVANVVAETAWVRNLLRELHAPLFTATLVYCDNVSIVYMSTNPVQHQRTKHIEIDIHFLRDFVASGHVRALYVPSRFQFSEAGLVIEDLRMSLPSGNL
ncbi:ribonuclease H-like domain-containing protein [Tanacetum coccineum]